MRNQSSFSELQCGKYYMVFVENLIFFITVQKLRKSVHIWQSYHRLFDVLFYGPQWTCNYWSALHEDCL